jgi:predicted nucleic acid-binding protein
VIFIDTGAFLARYLSNDQHHRSALVVWEKLASNHENCVTSNFVLDETFTLLGRRAGYGFAVERAKRGAIFQQICGSACQL